MTSQVGRDDEAMVRGRSGPLEVDRRGPLPGNRPIVRTNKDPQMDEFVGYMD